jgi:hypothetical protein
MTNRFIPLLLMITVTSLSLMNCSSPKRSAGANAENSPKAPGTKAMEEPPPPAPSKPVVMAKTDAFLEDLLGKHPEYFGNILRNRDSFRVQVIYTRIDRQQNNKPLFTNYYFNVNPEQYFYPASTVKMPTALLALQRLNEMRIPGLDRNSTMLTGASYSGQNEVFNDPTTPDGRPTIAHYVKKIFLVSDNDAFNRLYEFLGQDYINRRLQGMGYEKTEIIHRLERALSEDENRHTNPVSFYQGDGNTLYTQPMQFNDKPYQQRNDWLGEGYYKGDKIVKGPMDFSKKNRMVLEDMHNIVKSILFPNEVDAKQRFNISPDDHQMVLKYMSQYPGETSFPAYPAPDYWDSYCKFLYWGSEKGELPKSIRIFNKVGDAYGFLTDAAYIVDFEKKIEFMVSATIYCNSDGILNDSKYDYDSVGFPFMKHLGRVLYDYEVNRPRAVVPDLSAFRIKYDR